MRKATYILPFVLSLICSSGVWAASITLTVVQNEEAPAIALEMSQTIEDEVLSMYFESGHIVSNSDIRFDGSRFTERNFAIKEAAFGLSDYLMVVSLHYGPAEITDSDKKTSYAELNTLTWRLVRVNSSAILAEKIVDVTKIKVTDFDPYKQSRLLADKVAQDSLIELQKNRK